MGQLSNGTVTSLLVASARGDCMARDQLWTRVYDELRGIAESLMRREGSDHTLQPTALVHEAYVRLMGGENLQVADRAYFYGAAAQAMRRILVERARGLAHHHRKRAAPAGILDELPAKPIVGGGSAGEAIEALDAALTELASLDRRTSDVVMLRFFAGLSVEKTAEVLDVSARTVKRAWNYGRTWLYRRVHEGAMPGEPDA